MKIATFLSVVCSSWAFSSTQTGSRIIGGEVAYAGEYPYAAAIYITTETGNYFCTGSLLYHSWILTAGQCVDGGISFTIVLGTNKLNSNEDSMVRVATDMYVLHPGYDSLTLANDIGLIKLRMPLEFTTYIRQAYLPFSSVFPGLIGLAYGWGQTSDDDAGLAENLNHVALTALSDVECKLTYGQQVQENMVCFSGNYNEGTCYGDSGSPVVQHINRGYTVIVAISTFFSSNGCESSDPSGYTQVFPYIDWIKNVTSEQ